MVQRVLADMLAADDHRGRHDLYVDEAAVLARPLRDDLCVPAGCELRADAQRLVPDARVVGDEVVDVSADRLGGRVTEQPLGCRVPRDDVRLRVDRQLQQRLEPALLALQFADFSICLTDHDACDPIYGGGSPGSMRPTA